MPPATIRIGVIGAGDNARRKHLPFLQKINGVEVVGVVNRSPASSRRVATEFGIPKIYKHWPELIADESLDAVLIGTWPYLHCAATLSALEQGKHTLCEARMAMNAREAHAMLDAAQRRPELVTQLVPSPSGLLCDYWIREQLAKGLLGQIYEVAVLARAGTLADPAAPHTWRTKKEYSGQNIMMLGIHHETVQRWFGDVASVSASSRVFSPNRPDPETKKMASSTVPESLFVSAHLTSGIHSLYHLSNVALNAGPDRMEIFGSRGTLKIELWSGRVELATGKSGSFKQVKVPARLQRHWAVEEDFIKAIRSVQPIELTTFADGVRYMEFTEAVNDSLSSGRRVALPLKHDC